MAVVPRTDDLNGRVQQLERELSILRQEHQASAEVLVAIGQTDFDLRSVLQTVVDRAGELCRADTGNISLARDGVFVDVPAWFRPPASVAGRDRMGTISSTVRRRTIRVGDRSTLLGRVGEELATVHIADTEADADYRSPFSGAQMIHTALGVPLLGRDRSLIGVLIMNRYLVQPYTPAEIELLERFAGQAVVAIDNAQAHASAQAQAAELQRLNDQLEQRVAERTAELMASYKEMEAFSYTVSHDLRAPLRSMDGFSQVLLEEYTAALDDQGRDYLLRIRAASQRMGRMIDAILDLSRVARTELRKQLVDLSALAVSILSEFRQAEPERSVESAIMPRVVAYGDPDLLRLALQNLLHNAWKFTAGRPDARIEFGEQQDPGRHAFFVRDNGAGFDAQYADALFRPFSRLHGREFPGDGVGLASVQRVIRRHGGQVWAEASVDGGATFFFSLEEGS